MGCADGEPVEPLGTQLRAGLPPRCVCALVDSHPCLHVVMIPGERHRAFGKGSRIACVEMKPHTSVPNVTSIAADILHPETDEVYFF